MMGDLDLLQAIDCSPENELLLLVTPVQDSLDGGLQPGVPCKRSMKCVANLVLVVNRLSKDLTCFASDLREDKLCSAIMDCVIEEIVVKTERSNYSREKKVIFKRSSSVSKFILRDTFHKDFTWNSGKLKLQAITLRDRFRDHRVTFDMFKYHPTHDSDEGGLTVLMSVGEGMHFSCSMSADKPELQLEECSLESLKEICEDENTNRFLFTRKTEGVSLTTFESVKYPGWFISTSYDGTNNSVEMCQETDGRVRSFRLSQP
ncbi:interleukin-1 beta [Austrofundulus limnaeus]|uniref:Interleukin-1 beta n=1 Tax=Austrofundulus limnaeus TaxID=52670 RepID=A0A2I4BS11_AUSLI|nr:PREDICTED: interleukin-1 beta-like [Austrofundulus limnaeus]